MSRAAHRLSATAALMSPPQIDVPDDVAEPAPDRYDVTTSVSEIMNRTLH
jgi:hypothetical protein